MHSVSSTQVTEPQIREQKWVKKNTEQKTDNDGATFQNKDYGLAETNAKNAMPCYHLAVQSKL